MSVKKKISIIAIISAIALIVIFAILGRDTRIKAEERINLEMEYVENLSNFVKQVDIVTAAYSSAQMDKEAYKERHEVLKNEYFILKNQFSTWLDNHKIKEETEMTVRGENAVANAQKDIDNLLSCTFTENDEPYDIYQLYYRYLEQKNRVRADITEFLAVYDWLQNKDVPFDEIMQKYNNMEVFDESNNE